MTADAGRETLATALRRGAPSRRRVVRAVGTGALAQLAGVALVGGAVGLLVWSATRPGLAAVAGLLVAVELVAFLRAPLRHAERVAAHDLGLDGLAGWRTWLLDAVATWAPSRLAAALAGDLLARCLEDADRLQDLWVRVLVPALSAVVALVVAGLAVLVLSPGAGVAVLGATALVSAVVWRAAGRLSALGMAEAELRGAVAARVVEYVHGIDALVLLHADEAHLAVTTALSQKADVLVQRRASSVAAVNVVISVVAGAVVVVTAVSYALPASQPAIPAGVFAAVLACAGLYAAIGASLESLGAVAGSARRLGGLAEPHHDGAADAQPGPLRLESLDVAAAIGGPALLCDVDLEIRPGEMVAVTGPSGSGKSALLAAAARLEVPRGGRVTLGANDVEVLSEVSLRRAVAWLPTHPGLLEGRVRDVMDFGRGLSDVELLDALRAVGLEVVLGPRGGLDAVIGSRAGDLSGGEARRLALARLLAARPRVLVLDEPTAGLDEAAAQVVLDALARSGAAVLVATHDERVARRAARVLRTEAHTGRPGAMLG